jgi:uncharacterized protein YhfF/GNAT superfamily N-acetyltransferase
LARAQPAEVTTMINIAAWDARHLDDLVLMWRASFQHGVGVRDPHTIQEQREFFLEQVLPTHEIRLARSGEMLVGFVAANTDSVSQLYVRVGWHRQGIGTGLLDWAKAQSGGRLWLYAFQRNQIACAFYERHGFVAVARGFEPAWQLDDVRYEWTANPHLTPPPPVAQLIARLRELGYELPPGSGPVRVDGYGDTPELSRELLDLIRYGDKRGGTGLWWGMQARGEDLPVVGGIEIVIDHQGEPALVVRTTRVEVLPYGEVTAEFAASEGEGDRTLASWRRDHWAYFGRECAALGRTPDESMPCVCSNFEVLFVVNRPGAQAAGD